ncbi:hypothetical protein OAG68_00995 [bacterium]|nr:hypothetical protein [bacterium]
MKIVKEILRLIVITIVSPSLGFGTLLFLDGARLVTPQDMGKGTFLLIGFAVAITVGVFLMRVWPSPYRKEVHTENPSNDVLHK